MPSRIEIIRQRAEDCLDAMDPFAYQRDWGSELASDSFNTLQKSLAEIHKLAIEIQQIEDASEDV